MGEIFPLEHPLSFFGGVPEHLSKNGKKTFLGKPLKGLYLKFLTSSFKTVVVRDGSKMTFNSLCSRFIVQEERLKPYSKRKTSSICRRQSSFQNFLNCENEN